MNNNNVEFAANEITRATETGGLSGGYTTLMSESQSMSKPDQAALTTDLVKNGVLPGLSFDFLDQDMQNSGMTSIDKSGISDLQSAADKSGDPLQAAMADSLANSFNGAAETRRVPGGRFGEMKTAIFADTLDDKIQASAGSGTPVETDTAGNASSSADQPASNTGNPANSVDQPSPSSASTEPMSEQVKSGDSYWTLAERALGLGNNQSLDKQQDQETFDLMKTLQSENGNAMLQPGDVVAIQANDLPQVPSSAAASADSANPASPGGFDAAGPAFEAANPANPATTNGVDSTGTAAEAANPATGGSNTEQVQAGGSIWSQAERFLGF